MATAEEKIERRKLAISAIREALKTISAELKFLDLKTLLSFRIEISTIFGKWVSTREKQSNR